MEATATLPAEPEDRVSGPVPPGRSVWVGVGVLALLQVLLGVPALRLWLVETAPAQALVEGVRMPVGLPRLGVPFGGTPLSWWLVETVAALVLLAVFVLRRRTPGSPGAPASRLRVFGRIWLDTLLAVVVGCLVQAVLGSFLTADVLLPYLLLVGGTLLFATLVGALAGLLVAAVGVAVERH